MGSKYSYDSFTKYHEPPSTHCILRVSIMVVLPVLLGATREPYLSSRLFAEESPQEKLRPYKGNIRVIDFSLEGS